VRGECVAQAMQKCQIHVASACPGYNLEFVSIAATRN
jgi:hypothetical protein